MKYFISVTRKESAGEELLIPIDSIFYVSSINVLRNATIPGDSVIRESGSQIFWDTGAGALVDYVVQSPNEVYTRIAHWGYEGKV